ncbi:MAG: hypothetical protein ACRC57_04705 [Sarcina sp.]
MNYFIIVQGSNDLNGCFFKGINNLLNSYKHLNNAKIYLIYSLIKTKEAILWKYNDAILESMIGIHKIDSKNSIEYEYIYKNKFTSLDIEKFLEMNYKKDEKNVLIVSGHGGIFESLLDMSVTPAKSINTYEFCNIINKYKFEIVVLDMCSLNYIEVIYELLYKKNLKNLFIYGGSVGVEAIDYLEFITLFESNKQCDILNNDNILLFDKDSLDILEYAKKIHSRLGEKVKFGIYTINDEIFNEFEFILNLAPIRGKKSDIKNNKIKYIKSTLNEKIDKKIYNQYLYSKNNSYTSLITESEDTRKNTMKYIDLRADFIKGIINLHNNDLNQKEIKILYEKYLDIRNEREYYNEKL